MISALHNAAANAQTGRLAGKTALITGASRGIGAAVAECYAKEGASLILTARQTKGLEETDDVIRSYGQQAALIPLDQTKGESVDQLGPTLMERYGRLDILVLNAAILGELTPITHLSAKQWEKVIATNLTANFRLLRSLHPLLAQAGTAYVLMVTSGVTHSYPAYWGAYSVSKAGLEALALTYRAEVEAFGISVHIIDPGVVRTDMRAKAFPGEDPDALPAPEEIVDRFLTPLLAA